MCSPLPDVSFWPPFLLRFSSLLSGAIIIVCPVPESAPFPVFASHPVTRSREDVFVCARPLWRGERARTGRVLKRSQTPSQCLWVSGFRPPFSRSCSVFVCTGPGPLRRTALCHLLTLPPRRLAAMRRSSVTNVIGLIMYTQAEIC